MKISRYYTKSNTQPPVAFSKAFLKHPRRSAIMQRFDFDWERIHRLLPQICHYGRGVDPEEVLNAYDRVEEFIREMTHWRLEHATEPFLKPLAYAHFLAGVLAASWEKTADANKKMSCFPPNMRHLLGPMTQAALDHLTMAADLEPKVNGSYRDTDRSHYGEAAITCALAEVTSLAVHVKAYLPIGSEPFTRLNLAHLHREYRQSALMQTALMPVDGKDWLRVCAVGIDSLGNPGRRTSINLPKSADKFGLVAHDIKRQLLDDSELRLFYLWSRMHAAYREIEEFEYRKAAMTTPNMHYPEIMPLLPDSDLTTRSLVGREQEALDAARTPSFPHDTLKDVNFCPVWDRRLAIAMIFDAPDFAMVSLFRRSLYHLQALNERDQPRYCQQACEAAFTQLNQLTLPQKDKLWFQVNLTAMLAQALNTRKNCSDAPNTSTRTVLAGIDPDALRTLPLKDRWLYHDIAAEVIGGPHRGLATRGRNLAKADEVPKSCDLISDARMLLAISVRDLARKCNRD